LLWQSVDLETTSRKAKMMSKGNKEEVADKGEEQKRLKHFLSFSLASKNSELCVKNKMRKEETTSNFGHIKKAIGKPLAKKRNNRKRDGNEKSVILRLLEHNICISFL